MAGQLTMTNTEFEQLFEETVNELRQTLIKKGKEYAVDSNRLSNFYSAALLNQETPELALWGFLSKHLISLRDFIKNQWSENRTKEQWWEKTGDVIAYCILLRALLLDRNSSWRSKNED